MDIILFVSRWCYTFWWGMQFLISGTTGIAIELSGSPGSHYNCADNPGGQVLALIFLRVKFNFVQNVGGVCVTIGLALYYTYPRLRNIKKIVS